MERPAIRSLGYLTAEVLKKFTAIPSGRISNRLPCFVLLSASLDGKPRTFTHCNLNSEARISSMKASIRFYATTSRTKAKAVGEITPEITQLAHELVAAMVEYTVLRAS